MDGPSVRTLSSRETWARSSQTGKRKAQWSKINNPIRKFSYFRVFFMNFSITNLVIQQPKTWKWYIFQKLSTTRIADIYRLYTLQKKKKSFLQHLRMEFLFLDHCEGLTVTVPKGAKRPQKEAKKGRPAGSTGSTAITPMRPCKASRRQKNMSETSVRAWGAIHGMTSFFTTYILGGVN